MRTFLVMLAFVSVTIAAAPVPYPLPADPGGRAWMGVCQKWSGEIGVRVEVVDTVGPASIAGIQTDDVIIRVNHNKMEEYGQLSQAIKMYRPGALLEIEVIRGIDDPQKSKKIVFKVKLTEKVPDDHSAHSLWD